MCANVLSHAGALGESSLTECAFERLLAAVNALVSVQLRPLAEDFFALVTFVWILSGVRADVCFQVAHKGALEIAVRAGVDFFLRMCASMSTQVAGGEKRSAANVALEVSFV